MNVHPALIYANAIMVNNRLSTEEEFDSTYDNIYTQKGGQEDKLISERNVPNGGFPPITVCKKKVADEKIRQTPGKNIVSLQEIMAKRRDFSPFLPNSN